MPAAEVSKKFQSDLLKMAGGFVTPLKGEFYKSYYQYINSLDYWSFFDLEGESSTLLVQLTDLYYHTVNAVNSRDRCRIFHSDSRVKDSYILSNIDEYLSTGTVGKILSPLLDKDQIPSKLQHFESQRTMSIGGLDYLVDRVFCLDFVQKSVENLEKVYLLLEKNESQILTDSNVSNSSLIDFLMGSGVTEFGVKTLVGYAKQLQQDDSEWVSLSNKILKFKDLIFEEKKKNEKKNTDMQATDIQQPASNSVQVVKEKTVQEVVQAVEEEKKNQNNNNTEDDESYLSRKNKNKLNFLIGKQQEQGEQALNLSSNTIIHLKGLGHVYDMIMGINKPPNNVTHRPKVRTN